MKIMKKHVALNLSKTLIVSSAFLAIACGKNVERETTESPAPRNTTAATLTVPQTNTTPIVQQLPQQVVQAPGLRPSQPTSGSATLELPSEPHRSPKPPAGLPSDWFTRPVVQHDEPAPSDPGCGCNFCDEIKIVTQSMEQLLSDTSLSVDLSKQESSLTELGYRRSDTGPRAKYEGEGCTTYTSKCDDADSTSCTKRTVCGRQYLVVSKFQCDSLFDKNVGVRMIVAQDRPDAIVSQVLTQSDFSSIDLKWSDTVTTSSAAATTVQKSEGEVSQTSVSETKVETVTK